MKTQTAPGRPEFNRRWNELCRLLSSLDCLLGTLGRARAQVTQAEITGVNLAADAAWAFTQVLAFVEGGAGEFTAEVDGLIEDALPILRRAVVALHPPGPVLHSAPTPGF
jgi:hypothetical protein